MGVVLIVDDEPGIGEVLRDILTDEGHEAVLARNGREALEALAQLKWPCVILLDLMMPVMSGWQVLQALKADVQFASIPVVVMSAVRVPKPDRAVEFLHKPFVVNELLDVVGRLCPKG